MTNELRLNMIERGEGFPNTVRGALILTIAGRWQELNSIICSQIAKYLLHGKMILFVYVTGSKFQLI